MLITKLVVHCSATKPSQNWGVEEVRRLHKEEFGWSDVGYHFVIKRDGTIQRGRNLDTPGAHAKGFNKTSLGVCLIGGLNEETSEPEVNYTSEQLASLNLVLYFLKRLYKSAKVLGHGDLPNAAKTCPCFDVGVYYKDRTLIPVRGATLNLPDSN